MTAQARGWGPGWPDCQTHRQENLGWVTGKVIADAHELIDTLCAATERRGYQIHADKSWGFACRSIRGSDEPSNHSWGLAVDINAPSNPMGSRLRTDMPSWMPRMWEDCGFRWGGRYRNRPDAMHYEYMGRPRDVAKHLRKARRYLEQAGGQTDEEDELRLTEGSSGKYVGRVQIRLRQFFETDRIAIDERYGPQTRDHVAEFQKQKNLLGDGGAEAGVVDWFTYVELIHGAHGASVHA